jgi:hypothetical protein
LYLGLYLTFFISHHGGKSSGWHILDLEFDSQWERIFRARVKKISSLYLVRSPVNYVSCWSPSGWAVVDWTVVTVSLVMGGQGSRIFSIETSDFTTS